MIRIILITLFFFVTSSLLSQSLINSDVTSLENVDLYILPSLDNDQLQRRHKSKIKGQSKRFAEPRDVNISIRNYGTWESTWTGLTVWRQRIQSPNAFSINLGFSSFELVGDVSLVIYNKKKSDIIGPFTRKDNDKHKQLWTPLISGDEIVLELSGSADNIENSKLELSRINHDFIDIHKSPTSGSCNLDVICNAADGWSILDNYRDIISSVGAFTLNGTDQCSGMLINNTLGDCRPYFITADHCNITENNAASVVVYWNFENSKCRQPYSLESGLAGDGMRTEFNTGAIKIASLRESDFALIELDDPIDPSLKLFFSGWQLSSSLQDTSICIHHPNVQEKRISFDFDRMRFEISNGDTAFIRVLDWDIGTTEEGSSGSPVFNSKKRFIGQLYGGLASCTNDLYDSFGWFNFSWDSESKETKSLKKWLDPLDSGVKFLDGRRCSYVIDLASILHNVCGQDTDKLEIELKASDLFGDNITYSINFVPEGLIANLSFYSGTIDQNNILSISGLSDVASGDYEIAISATDGTHVADSKIFLYVDSQIPQIPNLIYPAENASNVSTNIDLLVADAQWRYNTFQISKDNNFSQVHFTSTGNSNTFNVTGLDNNQTYFWRVKSTNYCGESNWSNVFKFTTSPSFCAQLKSNNIPIIISPIGENKIQSTIQVNYPVILQDVNVPNIKGSHSFVEDLEFKLKFRGQEVELTSGICFDDDDFNFGFDDEALSDQISCPPTDSLLYQPKTPLTVFDNKLAGGPWSLHIADFEDQDGGALESWTIEICFFETTSPTIIPGQDHIKFCEGEGVEVNLFYDLKNQDVDFDLQLFNQNSELIPIEYFKISESYNQVKLILEKDAFQTNINRTTLLLLGKTNGNVLAFSTLTFKLSGKGEPAIILSPENGIVYDSDELKLIEWQDDFRGKSIIEIASKRNFDDPILSQTVFGVHDFDIDHLDLVNGTFYLRVMNVYACGTVSSKVVEFVIDDDTNTKETYFGEVVIVPNPSQGKFYLKNKNNFENNTKLEMYDMSGKIVYPGISFITSHLVLVDIENFGDGVYILQISKGIERIQKKIIKLSK